MADKIVEMTAQQFRAKLQEMVRLEFAKRLTEADEPTDDSNKEEAVARAKDEILRRLQNAVVYKDRTSGVERDETKEFLEFIKDLAGKTSKESLMGVTSLEDLAGRIAVNFSTSQDWQEAKKEADSLTTKYIVSKGERKHAAKKEMMATNKEFKGKEEEILQTINNKLIPPRGSKGVTKATNVVAFANWLKKNYPNVLDQSDDPVTALTKYAEFWSQPTVPANKSILGDLNQFLATSRVGAGIDKVLGTIDQEEKADREDLAKEPESGDYTTVTGLEGDKLEAMAKALGVSAPTINNILASIPPGKVKAIYDAIAAQVKTGNTAEAKRSLEQYAKITDSAIKAAQKEFLLLIDDAIDLSTDEFTLANLLAVLDEEGLREGLTSGEMSDEDLFLSRVVEIVNDPEFANNDEWKAVVSEMLKRDLEHNVTVKTPQGKRVRTGNTVKSFQNLVAKAVGLLDPGSRAFGRGRKGEVEKRAQVAQEKEFGQDYYIGGIGKQQRAPRKAKATPTT